MIKKLNTAVAMTAIGLCSISQMSLAEPQLFKEYTYGSSITYYQNLDRYYNCPPHFGEHTLCIDGVDFADRRFSAALHFNNSKLAQVTLTGNFSAESMNKIQSALGHSFTLLSMEAKKSNLDVIELKTKPQSDKDVTRALIKFENKGLAERHLVYVYAEGINIGSGAKNARAAYSRAHENDRIVELVVSDSALEIAFSLPKLKFKSTQNPSTHQTTPTE